MDLLIIILVIVFAGIPTAIGLVLIPWGVWRIVTGKHRKNDEAESE